MRVFALLVALNGLEGLLHLTETFAVAGLTFQTLLGFGVISSLVLLALAVVIWARASGLASYALDQGSERGAAPISAPSTDQSRGISAGDILAVAVTILAVYLLSQALVHGFSSLGWYLQPPDPPLSEVSDGAVAQISSAHIETAKNEAFTAGGYLLSAVVSAFAIRPVKKLVAPRSQSAAAVVAEHGEDTTS
jgi:hypothetical protein